MHWSAALLNFLLEELWTEREIRMLVGPIDRLPPSRYPQAVAVALALRHSWRQDTLKRAVKRLGLSTEDL